MVGGTDIGLEKRRKRNPISIDAAESRYWRSCGLQAVCGSQPGPLADREYCSECRTVFCRFVRNRECTKRDGRFVSCRIFRRSGQGQIAADPLKI